MRLRTLMSLALLASPAFAQVPDSTRRVGGGSVTGVVHDSIGRAPLARATVQIVAHDVARVGRIAVADSLGRFTLGGVPAGRYTIGFFHPMLDSLGMEAPLREVSVDGERDAYADLAIPSPAKLRAAICGPRAAESGAAVVGTVRDAVDGSPVAGVTVTGEWLEMTFKSNGIMRRIPRIVTTTSETGRFSMCNVPTGGTMAFIAVRGADSTDYVDVEVPEDGLLRRELYLGRATTVVSADSTQKPSDTPLRTVRRGDGRLSGTVFTSAEGRPLVGAQVGIVGGPQTRVNERGDWSLADVPTGTRMLEVHAIGYYPVRRRVDVLASAPVVNLSMATLRSVLDTVKVTASRPKASNWRGFEQRRISGIGRYLTAKDIERRAVMQTSDLFANINGVLLAFGADRQTRQIMVRGIGERWCEAEIYLDNARLPGVRAEDLNVWVNPHEIAGIEIYSGVGTPTQYMSRGAGVDPGDFTGGCGSVLIWTK